MKNRIIWMRIQKYNAPSVYRDHLGSLLIERDVTIRMYQLNRARIIRASRLFEAYMTQLIKNYNHDKNQFISGISIGE